VRENHGREVVSWGGMLLATAALVVTILVSLK
jgi:hypothetical protein